MESGIGGKEAPSREAVVLIVVIYNLFWAPFFINLFLTFLDTMTVHTTIVMPDEIRQYYTPEMYYRSKLTTYLVDWISLTGSLISCIVITIVIRRRVIWRIWNFSSKIVKKSRCIKKEELTTSLISMFIILGIQSIPDILHDIFFNPIMQYHDIILNMIAWLVMIFVFPCIVYYGTNKFGTKFYIYFVLICSILLFLVAVISNELLAYVPKDEIVKNDTELEDGIRNISRKTSIPADKIYFVEENENINAFTAGFFNSKEIVVFDSFLQCVRCQEDKCKYKLVPCTGYNETGPDAEEVEQLLEEDSGGNNFTYNRYFTTDEILAVIAHEIGHWKGNHPTKALFVIMTLGLTIWLCCAPLHRSKYLYEAFEFRDDVQPAVIGYYLIYTFVFIPINDGILAYPLNVFIRFFEYSADQYAKNIGYGQHLKSALTKAQIIMGMFPISNKLYSILKMDHPTLMERIDCINET